MFAYGKILAIIALSPFFLATTGYASVSGTVTNMRGVLLAGAMVTITDELDSKNTFSTSTDSQGHFTIDFSKPSGIHALTPFAFSLEQNYPNPFNPTTTIPFTLSSSGLVSVVIYNVTGQKVASLVTDHMSAGFHSVTWNGTDHQGYHVGAGIYLYQLRTELHVETKKMLLLDGGDTHVAKPALNLETRRMASGVGETTWTVTVIYKGNTVLKKTGVKIIDGKEDFYLSDCLDIMKMETGFTMVYIPEGSFQMGSKNDATAQPIRVVSIIPGFEMSTTEITQEVYQALIGSNPSHFTGDVKRPVENVSWWDAIKFCNAVSEEEGLEKCYDEVSGSCDFTKNGCRLPTEAEWEYACRAGSTTEYNLGDTENDLSEAGWYGSNSGGTTHEVGGKKPNAWGLYDMHGNVYEWCNDWWGGYPFDNQTNPTGPQIGSDRVIRGSGWSTGATASRTARRNYGTPGSKSIIGGFRVARIPPPSNN